jgi:hypothetical protein
MVHGEVGDIWRFDTPPWDSGPAVCHYLILEISNPIKNNYYVYCFETGQYVEDLILDEANFRNYNARKVA